MRNKKLSILIAFLFISLCGADTLTFYENLTPERIITYSDNSIVVRLIEKLNDTCNVQYLTYRVIYSNGTNDLVTVYDHQIPFFNFCAIQDSLVPESGPINRDKIFFATTIPNYVFVIYNRITEENINVQFGMLIDLSGKIIR